MWVDCWVDSCLGGLEWSGERAQTGCWSLSCAPLESDASITEVTSSSSATSRAHAAVEEVTDVQSLCRSAFRESLLSSATGWPESATDGCINVGQHAGLDTQLLHPLR